jgi:uncharacterized damage-inducible protein DinB
MIAVLLVLTTFSVPAQTPAQANSATREGLMGTYTIVKGYIEKAVAQVGQEHYAYKPTPEVRSMGQLFGHVADANFMICSAASGEKSPVPAGTSYEKVTSKAAMQKAIADSFAFCDKAWAAVAGAKGTEAVEIFGMKHTRASMLAFNTAHDWEHYGNLVTYMRLKGMVPPSSQGGGDN